MDNGGVATRIIKLSRARMYFSFLANFFTPPSDLCTRDTSSSVHLPDIYCWPVSYHKPCVCNLYF